MYNVRMNVLRYSTAEYYVQKNCFVLCFALPVVDGGDIVVLKRVSCLLWINTFKRSVNALTLLQNQPGHLLSPSQCPSAMNSVNICLHCLRPGAVFL